MVAIGSLALGLCGVIASFQPDADFGRVLACGGVFKIGSLAWGMAFDGFPPDRSLGSGRRRGCLIGSGCSSMARGGRQG